MFKFYSSALTIFLLVLSFTVVPHKASAYEVVSESVQAFGANTYLYIIKYDFGFLNADAWLPIGAIATSSYVGKGLLSYEINSGADTIATHAAVLSTAEISSDGKYYIPRGTRESFTLVILAKSTLPTAVAPALKVTAFPYTLRKNDDPSLRTYLSESNLNTTN